MKIATYNIQNGAGVGHDMSLLAEDIRAMELDIIGLQEVDVCTSRALGLDTLKLLAEAAGYPYYAFTKSIDFGGGGYGTAIISRYPIITHESVPLDTPAGYEARAYGHATIDVNGTELHLFNTHLSWEDVSIRSHQFSRLAKAAESHQIFVVCGDFNTQDLNEFEVFERAELVNMQTFITHPATESAIDNIILSDTCEIVESGMHTSNKSDHNLLWAKITLKNNEPGK